MMKVFENIKRLREERGLSQSELGMLVGYSRSAICRIEKGDFNITQEKILKFAEVFDVYAGDLMGWEEPDVDQYSLDEKAIIYRYRMLNATGRKTAMGRIEELTLIPKYAKADT